MKPTPEQQAIIEAAKTHSRLVIQAGAGTGKTSTLRMVASEINSPMLYIAYNQAIKKEAEKSFPKHVNCKTSHGLAFAVVGKRYAHRLKGGRQTSRDAAQILGTSWLELSTTLRLTPAQMARIATDTVQRFCYSADDEIGHHHVPHQNGVFDDNHQALAQAVLPYARRAWSDLRDTDGRLRFNHDHYLKCQPPGTMVTVTRRVGPGQELFEVPIEQILPGDKVATWGGKRLGTIRRTGRAVTHVGRRDYHGDLITVTTPSGATSSYTDDHICVTSIGDAMDCKTVVYLMRRGQDFRIGRVMWRYGSQGNTLGLVTRIRSQAPDAVWVLSCHDDDRDAALAEALAQHEFGIPGWQFKSLNEAMPLDQFWAKAGNNHFQATACLKAHGPNPLYPLWQRGQELRTRVPMQVRACNLMDGMRVCEVAQVARDGRGVQMTGGWTRAWQPVLVTRHPYDGPVHSIEVEVDHTYIADGIVTHNCWALTRPRLDTDVVLLDEAQDSNPLVAALVQQQDAQQIAVGDSNQSLYGWRGAVDALGQWDADHRLFLSQSWRFGPAIADEANKWLAWIGAELRLTGNPALRSRLTDLDAPRAMLCRTNAGAISEVMDLLNQGLKVALVGKGDTIRRLAFAAAELKETGRTSHPELFVFTSWADLQTYVEEESEGRDLKPFVDLIDEHGTDAVIDAIDALVDEKIADVTVSTAHASKGREWEAVKVGDDYPTDDSREDTVKSDAMVAYVAVTRARMLLDRGGLAWIDKHQRRR